MRTKLLPVLLVLLLATTGSAAVSYDIAVRDGNAYVNSTFQLYGGDDTYNVFSTTWQVPEDARLLGIRDSRGSITEYERTGGTISFKTNQGPKRNSETVKIRYVLPNQGRVWKGGLHSIELQLPGFEDKFEQFDEEDTSAQITVPEPVLGTGHNHGFRSSYEDATATFAGEGPINLKVTYTSRDGQYDHFILFGDANLTRADDVYPLLNRLTGRTVDFRKFAVVVVDGSEHSELFDPWIAGKYRDGGLVFVKKSEVGKNTFTGLVTHEVMHGFNQKPLTWKRTQASLFTEGTSEFAEWIVNTKLGVRQPEIFGETVSWRASCENQDGTCIYRLGPRGTPEDLWQYYEQDHSFMESWTPSTGDQFTDDLSKRTFGYAFSELFVRRYMMRNGPTALHAVYDTLERHKQPAETGAEYSQVIEGAMGTSISPCKYSSQDRLTTCLEGVHEYAPAVPSNVSINGTQKQIVFKPVEVPEPDEATVVNNSLQDRLLDQPSSYSRSPFVQGFVDWTLGGLQKFINFLSTVWD